jgi:murein DD-endopeptidase MepM/ murein hydrolase activator NlpD
MAPRGLPVFAATGGTVPTTWTVYEEVRPGVRAAVHQPGIGTVSRSPNGDGGNYVLLVDGTGRHHYYAHLNEPALASIGQAIQAGQLLGYVGNTGRSARGTPPHLHYQVTTRPTPTARGPLTFWNPFLELMRLASALGGQRARSGWRIEIAFDDFLRAVQSRHGVELVDPWSGAVITPASLYPWRTAF